MSNKIETVYLSKSAIKKCNQFADERTKDSALYEKRGGFKKIDIVSGAMAESAVYKLLKSRGIAVSKPDFTIHTTRRKSYDADLSDGIHNFHVKGQTLESKQRYGASWIMQRKDPIINDPKKMHYLVPCTVDTENGRVEIYGVMSINTLIDNACIQECKLEWFRKTKVALYLNHIEDVLTNKSLWGFFPKAIARMEKRNEA